MDKASAYGAGDCRFESCRGHLLLQDYLQWLRRYDNLSAFVLHQVDVDLLIAEWGIVIVVPRGLEPRTLRLLAVRSNQLSYETSW